MFRNTERAILRLPVEDTGAILFLKYINAKQRNSILLAHTTKKFYPKPMSAEQMLLIAHSCRDMPEVQARMVAASLEFEVEAKIILAIFDKLTEPPTKNDTTFIERDERDNVAAIIDICKKVIVGWEGVTDDETGETITFSQETLDRFLEDGEEFAQWCMTAIPSALASFDILVNKHKEQEEKNSSGLSTSTVHGAETTTT